jgi:hypothetical protein
MTKRQRFCNMSCAKKAMWEAAGDRHAAARLLATRANQRRALESWAARLAEVLGPGDYARAAVVAAARTIYRAGYAAGRLSRPTYEIADGRVAKLQARVHQLEDRERRRATVGKAA